MNGTSRVAHWVVRGGALQTKVGRRIVLQFVLSALLPATVLAVATYLSVGHALTDAARAQAQLTAKRLGMMISDRLDVAARALEHVARDPAGLEAWRVQTVRDSASGGLSALVVVTPDGGRRPLLGAIPDLPALTARQREHLDRGEAVVTVGEGPTGPAVLLAHAVRTGRREGVLWARLRQEVIGGLLDEEGADRQRARVCVVESRARTPVSCPGDQADLWRQVPDDVAAGAFAWSGAGESRIVGYWSLFLDFRFASPEWRVVYSEPREAAMAPLARFRRTFLVAVPLALLVVAFLSHVQLRRSLDPLRALHEGTERVGRREFDRPVDIRSGDEFEDVARGFNAMAQSLKRQFAEGELLTSELEDVSDELRAREAQLRGVLESAADGIVVVGDDGRIRSFNRAAEHLFGCAREEARDRAFRELFAVPLGEGPVGLTPTEGVGSPTFEVLARRRDGSTFAAELTFGKVDAAGGAQYTVFVRDVGDRKRAAEEQERLEAQLRQAQKMETIGTLAGGIAHDFNNVLTPILGHVALALTAVGDQHELRSDLEPIRDAAHRAKDLVKRILTFSRSAAEDFRPVDVGAVVRGAVKFLRSSIPATIGIRSRVAEDVPAVVGDATQLYQVLLNLGTNAYHAMREAGGTLEVYVDTGSVDAGLVAVHPRLPEKGAVRLTIRDTGHGMDRATIERVFEPFFTTKPPGEGTGLGMSIVHRIVISHGGAITVRSEPGVGTEFTIFLPPARGPAVAGGEARDIPVRRGHGHVLVVDDDEVVGRLVARVLERVGYRVTVTTAPAEALELVLGGAGRFDLLVTDQTMPGMTGTQLAGRVRERHPTFPIILMTGYSELATQGSIERLGVSELLVKPVEIEPLAATVARVLQARRGTEPLADASADGGDHD